MNNAIKYIKSNGFKLERLPYVGHVSSAGLCVLLIMQNDCDGGVIMKSCNETVIENLVNTNIMIL